MVNILQKQIFEIDNIVSLDELCFDVIFLEIWAFSLYETPTSYVSIHL